MTSPVSSISVTPVTSDSVTSSDASRLETGSTYQRRRAARRILEEAIRAKKKGNPGDLEIALYRFQLVMGKHEDLIWNKVFLTEAYLHYAECISWTNGLYKDKPEELLARSEVALEYFKKTEDAFRDLRIRGIKSLVETNLDAELYSEYATLYVQMADAHETLGSAERAEECYREAVRLFGQSLDVLDNPYDIRQRRQQINYNMGWIIQYKLDDPDGARSHYTSAVSDIEQYGAMPYINVGEIHLGLGEIFDFVDLNRTAALEQYELALRSGTLDDEKKANCLMRIGEIHAVRALERPDGPERNRELERINRMYFIPAGEYSPGARLWTARIFVITAGEDRAKLERAASYITANMPAFDPEDVAEARLLRGETLLRLEMMKPYSEWDFSSVIPDLRFVIDSSGDRGLEARAYLMLAKISLARTDLLEAQRLVAEAKARAEDTEPWAREDINLTSTLIDGAIEFEAAEGFRYGAGENHELAVEHYRNAIRILEGIADDSGARVYLAKAYFGLAEMLRYGDGVQNIEESVEYYTRAIELTGHSTNPDTMAVAVLALVGLGKAHIVREDLPAAFSAYSEAESILNKLKAASPRHERINVLEAEVCAGLAGLHNMRFEGHDRNFTLSREYRRRADEAYRAIPRENRPGGLRNDIDSAARRDAYSPLMLDVSHTVVEGEQTIDDATSGERIDTHQKREIYRIEGRAPIYTSNNSRVTIGGFFETGSFETDPVTATYERFDFDEFGDPFEDPAETADIGLMETESIQRMGVNLTYSRDFGRLSTWATAGLEHTAIDYTVNNPTWSNYQGDFSNYDLNQEERTFTSSTVSLRGNLTWHDEWNGWRIEPSLDLYCAMMTRSESNGFEALNLNYLDYLNSNPDIAGRGREINRIEEMLENDTITDYQIQPGLRLTAPWRIMGGETVMQAKLGYGTNIIGNSMNGWWPLNDAMQAERLSTNLMIRQDLMYRGTQLTLTGIYNNDRSRGEVGDGEYWVGEAKLGFNTVNIFGASPYLYYRYSQSSSDENYSDTTNMFGLGFSGY